MKKYMNRFSEFFFGKADMKAKADQKTKSDGVEITGNEGRDEFNRGVDATDTRDDREAYELNVAQGIHGRSAKYDEEITPDGTIDLKAMKAEDDARAVRDLQMANKAREAALAGKAVQKDESWQDPEVFDPRNEGNEAIYDGDEEVEARAAK